MKIKISSVFPSDREAIFAKLQEISTLRYISAPLARFAAVGVQPEMWAARAHFEFNLHIMGINFGIHEIDVDEFSADRIFTRERNGSVPVWNHTITLEEEIGGGTLYTDIVEIRAGWKTVFVWLWANVFYRHRQRKWKKLL